MLAGVHVEHELPECPLQPRQTLLEHHKASAGEFRRGLEIHLAECLAELKMLLRRERIIALSAEAMMLDVVACIFTVGHIVERDIRDLGERIVQRLRGCFRCRLQLRDGFL